MDDLQIAIIGDIHKSWNQFDIDYFNQSSDDLILITGDLPGRSQRGTTDIAARLAKLKKPTYYIPGNHDGTSIRQLFAELSNNAANREKYAFHQESLCQDLKLALGSVHMCGYSLHQLPTKAIDLDLLVARPHSMGGPVFSFGPYLKKHFGVADFESSASKLKALIDQSQASNLIVLAHNGPSGLGAERHSIWGKDFGSQPADFGDQDLEAAITYAHTKGKKVLAVVAGHMHHHIKRAENRQWYLQQNETHYINAARVPRIFKYQGQWLHHFARITLESESRLTVKQLAFSEGEKQTMYLIKDNASPELLQNP